MALNLPCNSCTNKQCKRKESCRYVDKEVGTGKAWTKKGTFSVDLRHIEESDEPQNKFQRGVLEAIKSHSENINEQILEKAEIKEILSNVLSTKEAQVINYCFFEKYKQQEIARRLNVSQARVNFLIKRALKKVKNSFPEELLNQQKVPTAYEGSEPNNNLNEGDKR